MSANLFRDFYETVKEDSLRSRAKQSRRVSDSRAAPVTPRTERTWPLGSPHYQQPQVSCVLECQVLFSKGSDYQFSGGGGGFAAT